MHIQYYFQVILSIKQKVYSYREGFRNHKVYKIQSIREDNSKEELRAPPPESCHESLANQNWPLLPHPSIAGPIVGGFWSFFSPSFRPLNGRCILKFTLVTRYDPQIVLYRRIQRKVTACWLLSAETWQGVQEPARDRLTQSKPYQKYHLPGIRGGQGNVSKKDECHPPGCMIYTI